MKEVRQGFTALLIFLFKVGDKLKPLELRRSQRWGNWECYRVGWWGRVRNNIHYQCLA